MKIPSYGSNFKMLECRTVRHPVSPVPESKKLTVPEPVRYRTKLMQSGIFYSGTGFLYADAQLWLSCVM
jgi:hypothetical protein